MWLAHQGADRTVQHHLAGGVAVDAHFVFQATAVDAIALADAAVGVDVEFGHHKQADAFAADGRIGQAGQHQVHDVVGEVVFTRADENLLAGQAVSAIGLGFGLGAQQTQIGAAVRFGQAHGAGPLAAGEFGQVQAFLLVGAVRVQALISAVAQTRVHGPGLVGRVHHLVEALVDHKGQALAAELGVARQRGPAARHVLCVGFLEALGRGHRVGGFVQCAALFVAADVEREGHLGRKLATFFEHRVDGVGVGLGVGRQGLELVFHAQHLVHHELHVAQGRGVARHGGLLKKCGKTMDQALLRGLALRVSERTFGRALWPGRAW